MVACYLLTKPSASAAACCASHMSGALVVRLRAAAGMPGVTSAGPWRAFFHPNVLMVEGTQCCSMYTNLFSDHVLAGSGLVLHGCMVSSSRLPGSVPQLTAFTPDVELLAVLCCGCIYVCGLLQEGTVP
jgi:hypothetical protein